MYSGVYNVQGSRGKIIKRADGEVLPLHFLDDVAERRSEVLVWTLRFNDVLDPELLYDSLSRLLEAEGWRKLGGRLRQDVNFIPLEGLTSLICWVY